MGGEIGYGCDQRVCFEAVGLLDRYCLKSWDEACASCAKGQPGINGLDCSSITQIGACQCDDGGGDARRPWCSDGAALDAALPDALLEDFDRDGVCDAT